MSNPTTPSDPGSQESPESGAATPAPPAPDAPTTPDPAAAEKPAATQPTPEKPAEATKPAAADKAAPADKPAPTTPPAAPASPSTSIPDTTPKADSAAASGAAGAASGSTSDKPADKAAAAEKPASTTPTAAPTTDVPEGGETEGEKKVRFYRRGPFVTVAGALVVLLGLAVLGYVWGLGPLNRLNTARGITPPAKLAGLDRVTDADIRNQLQLDQTRQALSRINNGKQATVEAYGNLDGNRLFVVIALRGKVDIAKTVADSGAPPDKVKRIGQATCVETTGNLPTQCYRGSNTLTVIAQSANEGVTVDQVAPVAVEAFHAMK